ncbi:MAG: DUF1385 domain-containing protein [bacterium]|nr:DUF1385 domain-containing protein [bacterium]
MANKNKKMMIGGQAVIEGVMMRSANFYAVALRRKSGDIDIKIEPFKTVTKKFKLLAKPFLRGIVSLFEMMILGMKTLSYSADIYSLDLDENAAEKERKKNEKAKKISWDIIFSIIFAFGFGILLFVLLPLWLTNVIKTFFNFANNPIIYNIIDGIMRLIIFLTYVIAISFMKDIQRVFAYHGAEHMAVYTNENNDDLTIENAKKYTTLHPRCGTNFMFIVIILGIFMISLFPIDTFMQKFLIRLIIMPLVASISYEIIRFLGNNYETQKWARFFFSPGLMLQKLTTNIPDDSQIEVALKAMKAVLDKEKSL